MYVHKKKAALARLAWGKTTTPGGITLLACVLPPHLPTTLRCPADTRRSALWFAVYTCVLMPWMLAYWIGGPKLLGQGLYDALDVSNLDLAAAGLSAG